MLRVGDGAVLENLGESGAPLRQRQRLQRAWVDHDQRGPVKRADEVLSGWRVDAGLAADRRVDHCEQRCRDLHDRNAARVCRSDEAGEITNDAAA